MTREPQVMSNFMKIRVPGKSLFFNKSDTAIHRQVFLRLVHGENFAGRYENLHSEPLVKDVEHRPASRPGAGLPRSRGLFWVVIDRRL